MTKERRAHSILGLLKLLELVELLIQPRGLNVCYSPQVIHTVSTHWWPV